MRPNLSDTCSVLEGFVIYALIASRGVTLILLAAVAIIPSLDIKNPLPAFSTQAPVSCVPILPSGKVNFISAQYNIPVRTTDGTTLAKLRKLLVEERYDEILLLIVLLSFLFLLSLFTTSTSDLAIDSFLLSVMVLLSESSALSTILSSLGLL